MKTRCKMLCESFTKKADTNEVKFVAVHGDSQENKDFFKFTPFGELSLAVINSDIEFEAGKEYYIDITQS